METASVREASARVIAALSAAGRSRTTIKRHEAELNAFARFMQARGQDLPTEVDCLDFVAERSGCRLACLREPASSREAQLARRPLALLVECLDGACPWWARPPRRWSTGARHVSVRRGTNIWLRADGGATPKRAS